MEVILDGRLIVLALCGDFAEFNEKSNHGAPWCLCAVNLFGGQDHWSEYWFKR